MKNKKRLSLTKMNITQLETIKGGNNVYTITARNTSPILCNYATLGKQCQATVRETFIRC